MSANDNGVKTASEEAQRLTCDALCSLSATTGCSKPVVDGGEECPPQGDESKKSKSCPKTCSKQLQLPMFLSKTYHMIDRCDSEVATWSESGDNFVVKNVEKFASAVLPLYFKHSNFSSFARQLNFYGFRKLRADPILQADVDKTSCYVRFYHEHFQKDKPDLLHLIKRATKTDQQSNKDDVDALKTEVAKLKEGLATATAEYNRKIAELSYECNRRITSMNAEYDKLALFVQRSLGAAIGPQAGTSLAQVGASGALGAQHTAGAVQVPDLLHSLSQAAMTIQTHLGQPAAAAAVASVATSEESRKRSGDDLNSDREKKQ